MPMVYCRGCGKEIHDSAPACPHCGALQGVMKSGNGDLSNSENEEFQTYHWSSIASFVTGIIGLILAVAEPSNPWSSDAIVGGIIIGCIPVAFGIIALSKKRVGSWMAITGLITGCLLWLISIGSM